VYHLETFLGKILSNFYVFIGLIRFCCCAFLFKWILISTTDSSGARQPQSSGGDRQPQSSDGIDRLKPGTSASSGSMPQQEVTANPKALVVSKPG